jgi:hypothetical protein
VNPRRAFSLLSGDAEADPILFKLWKIPTLLG